MDQTVSRLWMPGDEESCVPWNADQHLAVACELLDSNVTPYLCESPSEDGTLPPHRYYDSMGDTHSERGPTVSELASYVAALTHATIAGVLTAQAKQIGDQA